ncbi:mechanosensitive ion channel domain-containing protein [Spirulina sp. 06S082]|uniref:mechanosensitive ion channel domain-containing protein n=1 Tax=Spirulina sp. 06S082 TaxID=3110248 RepID=UPI002B2093F7|nr:mechanosensitive ion channel domain-containing protein [Spirulina sp. 06S082]MEA5469042.1 mechanosensitive ion channel domain-containing protein [Spirulina sp. 06S082]
MLESRFFKHFGKWLLLGILTFLVVFHPTPIAAQMPANSVAKAPILLDGNILFEVGGFGNFSPRERAKFINQRLISEATTSESEIDVEILQENGQVILQIGDRYLLTLTENDLLSASTPFQQGKLWRKKIAISLQEAKEQRTPKYQKQAIIWMVSCLFAAIVLIILLSFSVEWSVSKFFKWIGDPEHPLYSWEQPVKFLLRIIWFILDVTLCLSVFYWISDRLPQTRILRYQLFWFISEPIIPLSDTETKSIQDIIVLVLMSLGLWFVVSLISRWMQGYICKRSGQESGTYEVIAVLIRYGLICIALLILLPLWGLNLASLAILASFLGVGIGFGVQNIVNNFVSGLIIAIERPIKVGDFVTVEGLEGSVERIGSRSTIIRTLDRVTIVVPNSRFLDSETINRSYGDPVSRLKISISVAYGSNVPLLRKALLEVATSHPEVLLRPEPQVWFLEFGDSSLNFELRVWTADPKQQARIKSDLNYRIEANLNHYNIEMPFPQRDLNLRSPQLQQLVQSLQQKYPLTSVDSPLKTTENESDFSLKNVPMTIDEGDMKAVNTRDLSHLDVETLVIALKGSEGIEIKDRRYRLKTYSRCFIGAELVDWLMVREECSREDAIAIGEHLRKRGILHHVTDEHPFLDEYLFYQFYY